MRGTIEKLPSGKFLISVFLGKDAEGKWIRTRRTVEGTKKDAERELTKMLRDLDTGGYVEPAKLTVREYLERWLRDYVATHVEKESTRQEEPRPRPQHDEAPEADRAAAQGVQPGQTEVRGITDHRQRHP